MLDYVCNEAIEGKILAFSENINAVSQSDRPEFLKSLHDRPKFELDNSIVLGALREANMSDWLSCDTTAPKVMIHVDLAWLAHILVSQTPLDPLESCPLLARAILNRVRSG